MAKICAYNLKSKNIRDKMQNQIYVDVLNKGFINPLFIQENIHIDSRKIKYIKYNYNVFNIFRIFKL